MSEFGGESEIGSSEVTEASESVESTSTVETGGEISDASMESIENDASSAEGFEAGAETPDMEPEEESIDSDNDLSEMPDSTEESFNSEPDLNYQEDVDDSVSPDMDYDYSDDESDYMNDDFSDPDLEYASEDEGLSEPGDEEVVDNITSDEQDFTVKEAPEESEEQDQIESGFESEEDPTNSIEANGDLPEEQNVSEPTDSSDDANTETEDYEGALDDSEQYEDIQNDISDDAGDVVEEYDDLDTSSDDIDEQQVSFEDNNESENPDSLKNSDEEMVYEADEGEAFSEEFSDVNGEKSSEDMPVEGEETEGQDQVNSELEDETEPLNDAEMSEEISEEQDAGESLELYDDGYVESTEYGDASDDLGQYEDTQDGINDDGDDVAEEYDDLDSSSDGVDEQQASLENDNDFEDSDNYEANEERLAEETDEGEADLEEAGDVNGDDLYGEGDWRYDIENENAGDIEEVYDDPDLAQDTENNGAEEYESEKVDDSLDSLGVEIDETEVDIPETEESSVSEDVSAQDHLDDYGESGTEIDEKDPDDVTGVDDGDSLSEDGEAFISESESTSNEQDIDSNTDEGDFEEGGNDSVAEADETTADEELAENNDDVNAEDDSKENNSEVESNIGGGLSDEVYDTGDAQEQTEREESAESVDDEANNKESLVDDVGMSSTEQGNDMPEADSEDKTDYIDDAGESSPPPPGDPDDSGGSIGPDGKGEGENRSPHTFKDWVNPDNYENGKYIGESQDWGYKPYGEDTSNLRNNIENSPEARMSAYMNEHGYGPDDYAEYSQDPEWRDLNAELQNKSDVANHPENSYRDEMDKKGYATISANDIQGVDSSGEHFWDHHGSNKEDFTEIASKLPDVQEQLDNGATIEEIRENPDLKPTVDAYYDPDNMVVVEKTEDGFRFQDNGRHRVAAARELGYDVPVKVVEVEDQDNEQIGGQRSQHDAEIYEETQDVYPRENTTEDNYDELMDEIKNTNSGDIAENYSLSESSDKIKQNAYDNGNEVQNLQSLGKEVLDSSNERLDSETHRKINDIVMPQYEGAGRLAAEDSIGRAFTDHKEAHVTMVVDKSIEAGGAIKAAAKSGEMGNGNNEDRIVLNGNIDFKTLEGAALSHDTGMSGGGYALSKNADDTYEKTNDGKYIVNKENNSDFNQVRENHSLNSALNILKNRDAYIDAGYSNDQIDKMAVECMAHSKSSSGVKDLNSRADWSDCFDRIDATVDEYNKDHPDDTISYDRSALEQSNQKMGELASETLALRIGDVSRDSFAGAEAQSGEGISIDRSTINDRAGTIAGEIQNASIKFENSGDEITSDKSRRVHVGEQNIVENHTTFTDGRVSHDITVNDGISAPKCTQVAIGDHLGEFASAKDEKFVVNVKFDKPCDEYAKESYEQFRDEAANKYDNIEIKYPWDEEK